MRRLVRNSDIHLYSAVASFMRHGCPLVWERSAVMPCADAARQTNCLKDGLKGCLQVRLHNRSNLRRWRRCSADVLQRKDVCHANRRDWICLGQKVWPRPQVAKTFAKRNNITNAKSDTPSSFHVARVDVATFSTKLLKGRSGNCVERFGKLSFNASDHCHLKRRNIAFEIGT
jgi:hypothetical protein